MLKTTVRSILNRLYLKLNYPKSGYEFPHGYRRVYHYHIRKSAGTALNSSFWALAGLDLQKIKRKVQICHKGFVFVRHDPNLINAGQYFYANSHIPSYRLNLPPQTFTITILRDPLNRLLSYYRYLVYVHTDPQAVISEPFYESVKKEAKAILGNNFQDFLQRVSPKNSCQQLYMFSSSYDVSEAVERVCQCSYICLTESFSEDIMTLQKLLQLNLQEQRNRSFSVPLNLQQVELDQARELLANEYSMIAKIKEKLKANR